MAMWWIMLFLTAFYSWRTWAKALSSLLSCRKLRKKVICRVTNTSSIILGVQFQICPVIYVSSVHFALNNPVKLLSFLKSTHLRIFPLFMKKTYKQGNNYLASWKVLAKTKEEKVALVGQTFGCSTINNIKTLCLDNQAVILQSCIASFDAFKVLCINFRFYPYTF